MKEKLRMVTIWLLLFIGLSVSAVLSVPDEDPLALAKSERKIQDLAVKFNQFDMQTLKCKYQSDAKDLMPAPVHCYVKTKTGEDFEITSSFLRAADTVKPK